MSTVLKFLKPPKAARSLLKGKINKGLITDEFKSLSSDPREKIRVASSGVKSLIGQSSAGRTV
jgi:hypothetical protein